MYKTSLKQGRDCSNVSKTIEKQGLEGSLRYCANGPMVVSSPMSKTRSKQGSEEKWGDCSNVSKTTVKQDIEEKWGGRYNVFKNIENQDTERTLGHGANGQMTIGKLSF